MKLSTNSDFFQNKSTIEEVQESNNPIGENLMEATPNANNHLHLSESINSLFRITIDELIKDGFP